MDMVTSDAGLHADGPATEASHADEDTALADCQSRLQMMRSILGCVVEIEVSSVSSLAR